MTKLRDYHEFSDKIETFCGRPQVAPTNKFGNQQNDKQEFFALLGIVLQVSLSALFVEVIAFAVDDDHNGEVFYFQTADGFGT